MSQSRPHDSASLIAHAPDLIGRYDRDLRLLEANPAFERAFGRPLADLLGHRPSDLLPGRSDTAVRAVGQAERLLRQALDEGVERSSDMVIHTVGGARIFHALAVPERDAAGQVVSLAVYSRDVTEQRRAESALRHERDLVRRILDCSPDSITISDLTGVILDCNNASITVAGATTPADLIGRSLLEFIPEGEQPRAIAAMQQAVVDESAGPLSTTLLRMDGTAYPAEITAALLRDADGEPAGLVGVVVDLTERRRAEAEVRQLQQRVQNAQRLESLGLLAGGIAHEFSNLLTSILGHASLALVGLSPLSPARESIHQIEGIARRAADLTRQMLACSGRGRFVVEDIDLSTAIRGVAHLLAQTLAGRSTLRLDLAADLPLVRGDAAQLRQVITNLVVNAAEAADDPTACVVVATRAVDLAAADLRSPEVDDQLPAGRYVCVEVADQGCGMADDVRQRIFEPFFSTKFTGRGLGLPAVLGIVRGHRGVVLVDSAPGRGTTVRVCLPAAPRRAG